jgi:hypothetical protein
MKRGDNMVIYPGENEVKFVQTVASASTLLSSVTGEIKEYIISRFPRGYFKSVYIDTSETVSAQNRNEKYNKNLNKLPMPNLAITPQISLDDPIGAMDKSQHMSSPNLFLRKDLRSVYKRLVIDPSKKFSIYHTSDYITTNFIFRITTNKFVQNIDLAYYMKSRFQTATFQFLNGKYINSEVPKTFIKLIAEMLGLNVEDPADMEELQLYLISTGMNEDIIRKKVNALTGKIGFFVNEKVNFLTVMDDLDAPSSVVRDNMSEGEYTLSFRVQVSCWIPNAFIMSINKDKLLELNRETVESSLASPNSEQDEGIFSLSIGDNFLMNKQYIVYFESSTGESVIGQEISHNIFTYDVTKDLRELDLSIYLKEDFKKVHAYMVSKNFDLTDLMSVKIHTRDGELGEEYAKIDYESLRITDINIDGKDFSLSIFANRALFESVLEAIKNDEFFFAENALAVIRININDQEYKVKVYSFKSKKEMYSTDPRHSFRIATPYGIGYIGLLDDDPDSEDQEFYKICVGFNSDGSPIIKRLEIITE